MGEILGRPLFAGEDFIGSFWFFALGVIILLGLGGVLFYLRNKRED
jgi:LPXTG-motif cell wall-anchored protein